MECHGSFLEVLHAVLAFLGSFYNITLVIHEIQGQETHLAVRQQGGGRAPLAGLHAR